MRIFSLNNIISTILVLLILNFFPIIFEIDFLDPIQNTLEDFNISDMAFSIILDGQEIETDTNIVLVNIHRDRRVIAREIEIVNSYNPKVIGIDSFFKTEKGNKFDVPLENALAKVENLVLVTKLENYNEDDSQWDSLVTSHPRFIINAKPAYANFIIEDDQFLTVRTFTPKEYYQNSVQYCFAVKVAKYYDKKAVMKLLDRDNENEIISFKRNIDKYRTLDVRDLFDKNKDLSFIEGKIVLMGYLGPTINSPTNEDIFFTSMNDQFVGKNHPDMYGVVVWANIISMILEEDYFDTLPKWFTILFIIAVIFSNMVIFSYLRDRKEGWYEPVSIVMTFGQLILLFGILLSTFILFKVEIKSGSAFFAVLIAKQAYETWSDSLRPLTLDALVRKFKKHFKKMA